MNKQASSSPNNLTSVFRKYHLPTFLLIFVFICLATVALFKAFKNQTQTAKTYVFVYECDASVTAAECDYVKANGFQDASNHFAFASTNGSSSDSLDSTSSSPDSDSVSGASHATPSASGSAGSATELLFRVSAETVYNLQLDDTSAVYSVELPVTDFYDGTLDITQAALESCTGSPTDDNSIIAQKCHFVNLDALQPTDRVLSVDGNYYFDTFASGARLRVLRFSTDIYDTVVTASDLPADQLAATPFDPATYNHETAELLALVINSARQLTPDLVRASTLSFTQTGVTALSRAMTTALNGKAGGDGAYFAARIKDFLSSSDLTHISNEVSFVDSCKGGTNTMMLCADWRSLASIQAIGTDIVELSGNHNNNFGAQASLDTIAKYHELGMFTVGGGPDEASVKIPIRIHDSSNSNTSSNITNSDPSSITSPDTSNDTTIDPDSAGNNSTPNSSTPVENTPAPESSNAEYTLIPNNKHANITLLAYNESTSTKSNGELADGDRPGANGYVESEAAAAIAAAKARGDFVIVDIQFAECYSYPDDRVPYPLCDKPISGQQTFFRHLVDLGADMVVGTQAHQPQTFEIYQGSPIYYGLGNLFFDQTYWPDTAKGLILTHYFHNGRYIQTRISPTIYDTDYQVELMSVATASAYLSRLIESSPKGN